MKVILQQDVKGLGKKGALIEVAEGYGRNFLIPRGLAVPGTDSNLRAYENQQAMDAQKRRKEEEQAKALGERLAKAAIQIGAKSGEGGRLFGSITAGDVSQAIQKALGVTIDKRRIELEEPIKVLGSHHVVIKLLPGQTVRVAVQVVEARTA